MDKSSIGEEKAPLPETEMRLIDIPDLDNPDAKDEDQSDQTSSSGESSDFVDREKWGSKFEFLLACVGFSVAFGNVMRFPYLCMRNGGGAFLIPFFGFLFIAAFPLYFMEVCLGQFSGSSPLFVWRLTPLLKGLGWLMVLVSGIVSWYYNTIIAWVLYYLMNSFYPKLPWSSCLNEWNSIYCFPSDPEEVAGGNRTVVVNMTETGLYNTNGSDFREVYIVRNVSSAKEFWQHKVLGISSGIEEVGSVQIHLVIALFLAWVLIFLCLAKGVKSVGKVVYVTVLLPYVLMFVFLVRGLTLPGAWTGLKFYLTPDFSRLLETQVWMEAAVQVFYSLGPTWGGVITMASYNKFHHKCVKTAVIACLSDGLTSFFGGFIVFSVVGYMAHELGQPIEEVATAGPGLMFIAYPEAISKMPVPQVWAVLFFIMLITVGIDTQFCMFETLCSGVVDAFPKQLASKKTYVTATLTSILFLLSIPFSTNAGIYIYNLVDWYSSSICMTIGGCIELVAVGWLYGAERFSQDMKMMFGWGAPVFLRVCWCITSPLFFFIICVMVFSGYQDITYEGYKYPDYAITAGYILAFIPVLPLPICAIYGIITTPGTLRERFRILLKPENWYPNERKLIGVYENTERYEPQGVLEYVRVNILGHADNIHV